MIVTIYRCYFFLLIVYKQSEKIVQNVKVQNGIGRTRLQEPSTQINLDLNVYICEMLYTGLNKK